MVRTYKIAEIFYSIQGEGSHVGEPMIFIRFSGCNLKCSFCDTKHEAGEDYTTDQILAVVSQTSVPFLIPLPVCFTGGEPLLQLDSELLLALSKKGHPLHLETNGTLGPPFPALFTCITISPKKSLEEQPLPRLSGLLTFMGPQRDLKIVWGSGEPKGTLALMKDWGRYEYDNKFIQPMTFPDGSTNVREAITYIKENPEWKLSVQLHRILDVR